MDKIYKVEAVKSSGEPSMPAAHPNITGGVCPMGYSLYNGKIVKNDAQFVSTKPAATGVCPYGYGSI